MEGGDSEFANFTLPTLKAFLEARSQNVTRNLLVSQKTTQRYFFPSLHPLSPVIFATAAVVAFVLQRLLRNRPGSDAATSHDFFREILQRAFTRANQLH